MEELVKEHGVADDDVDYGDGVTVRDYYFHYYNCLDYYHYYHCLDYYH